MKFHTFRVTTWEVDSGLTGQSVRCERERLGLSLRDVARAMGISAAYLSDLERGNRAWKIGRFEQCKKTIKELCHARVKNSKAPSGV